MSDNGSDNGSAASSPVSNSPKKGLGSWELFRLNIYSDQTQRVHIFKVLLFILILLGVAAFVIAGYFYPECNGTQDRGFYSCPCKAGSALDESTGLCYCLDTGDTIATYGCSGYENDLRYVFKDNRNDSDSDEYGGWTTTTSC